MKRSRSGASRSGTRPSGARPKINSPPPRARYAYSLCVADGDSVRPPNDSEMAIFRQRHPELATQLDEAARNVSFEQGSWQARCLQMVNSALNNKRGVWFKAPVDPVRDNLPNYFEIIKEPMDLGTVRSYLLGGKYESEQDVARDVRLTFSNCMRFNAPP